MGENKPDLSRSHSDFRLIYRWETAKCLKNIDFFPCSLVIRTMKVKEFI